MTILTSPQDGNGARISPRPTLAHVPGVTLTSARPETTPTLPTIRARKPRQVHGAALASQTAAQVDALAAAICAARAGTMPAVTVAMEGPQ
jgi:hypothetical protein